MKQRFEYIFPRSNSIN